MDEVSSPEEMIVPVLRKNSACIAVFAMRSQGGPVLQRIGFKLWSREGYREKKKSSK